MRHPHNGKNPRSIDNQWTFGKKNEKTGYMEIASERVHRIVAFAYLGEPPNKEYVVDHIDTNRCNNRPDNLQWLTKLENTLKNPITVRKIEIICGSIEAFLANPKLLQESKYEPNFKWMRSVTPEEAKNCRQNMQKWARSMKLPSGGILGEWVYKPQIYSGNFDETISEFSGLVTSKTKGAAQKKWNVPSEFPCCPPEAGESPIADYLERLKIGLIFTQNDIYKYKVLQFTLTNDNQAILLITENANEEDAVKPWALAKITFENGLFVHTSLGSFFTQEGAEKQYTIAQGLEWTGGDSIDDYC
jgi:hypothetical protein